MQRSCSEIMVNKSTWQWEAKVSAINSSGTHHVHCLHVPHDAPIPRQTRPHATQPAIVEAEGLHSTFPDMSNQSNLQITRELRQKDMLHATPSVDDISSHYVSVRKRYMGLMTM
jgi:hypothetical protein